jgi:hypothetical protein
VMAGRAALNIVLAGRAALNIVMTHCWHRASSSY